MILEFLTIIGRHYAESGKLITKINALPNF